MRAQVSNAGAVEQGTGAVLIGCCIRCNEINAIEGEVLVLLVQIKLDKNLLAAGG